MIRTTLPALMAMCFGMCFAQAGKDGAGSPGQERIDLLEAIRLARSNSAQFQTAVANAAISHERFLRARAARLPALDNADDRFREQGRPAREAMVEAGRRRLRPIAMTAAAAMAGMFPLALSFGSGSQILQPLAIAVIGGIAVSMFLSLIVTPAVRYYLTGGAGR